MSKMKIPESKLIKALAELESVAKGELEDADPEGGLSAEGKPLSDAAPKGRGESTKKSRAASAASPFGGSASSSASSASSSSDDEDEDEPPPPKKSKKDDKGKKVSKAKSMSSSAGSSDDDEDDAEKSFREMADGDETMRKGILINDFLESMTDQLSLALLHVKESITKSVAAAEARITAHIDGELAKSTTSRREFDIRLARGLAAIGNTVQHELVPVVDMVKALSDQPVGGPRGKAVLSKGEVNQPPWSGSASANADQRAPDGASGDYIEALREIPTSTINDWLFKKSATSQIDTNVILAFEANRYDPALLPASVRKAICDELIK